MRRLLLMATNNQMCQDVAVVPFLWMLPLGLYLLSLIILFHKPAWYFRRCLAVAFIPAMVQVCYVLYRGVFISISWQIVSYSVALFVCCMICHGELVRIKPEPRFLTDFYLTVAAGGAAAGIFVAVAAPFLFKGYWEFHFGLAATALLILITRLREGFHDRRRWLLPGFWLVSFCALGDHTDHPCSDRAAKTRSSRPEIFMGSCGSWTKIAVIGVSIGIR